MSDVTPTFRHAVGFSMAQKYLAFAVQLGSSMVLARLLSPGETGVFSLAAAAVAVGHLLREFGLSDYIISQKDVTAQKLRAAFTVTLLMAWGIAAALWLVAAPLAVFYKEPALRSVMQVMCLSFLLLPFGTMAFAMLSKQMRFARIFVLQTGVLLVSATVTIGCAWRGLSSMSLAIGAVAANATTIVLLLLVQPGTVFLKPTLTGLREVVRFGGTVTVARLFETISNRSVDFIVPAMLGFHAGGLMSKAFSLSGSFHEFFNSAVVRVATPAFARADQQPADVRDTYLKATVLVATAQWVFYPLLAIFAQELVLLLFGSQWLGCVPIVQVTAVFAMLWAPFMLGSSLLTAHQAVAQQLWMQIACAPGVVLALLVGALYDVVWVTVLFNVAMLLRLVLLDRALRQVCSIGVEAVLARLGSSAVLAAGAAACGLGAKALMHQWGAPVWAVLPLGVACMLAAAVLLGWWLRHPMAAEVLRVWNRRRGHRAVQQAPL
jgi:O-antigen/teichoic acid export membrane protein